MKFLHRFNYLFALNISLIAGVFIALDTSEYAVMFAWTGWLIYLVLSAFLKAFFTIEGAKLSFTKVLTTTFSLVFPLLILIFDQGVDGAYKYFILGSTFEAAGLYFAILLMFLFGTGVDGKRSFESLGIGMVVVFLIIMSAFFLPYALINIDYYKYTKLNWFDIILALSGLVTLGINWIRDIVNLRNLSMKGLFVEEEENPLRGVGMIIAWMLGLNLVYVFASM